MTTEPPRLTGVLADIARAAGRDAAMLVAQKVGGTRVYFPLKPSPNHWLSELVGHEAALAICDEMTAGRCGLAFDVPIGPFGHQMTMRAKVDQMLAENGSERDIARATGYTTRGVRKRRQKARERHPDLFD